MIAVQFQTCTAIF